MKNNTAKVFAKAVLSASPSIIKDMKRYFSETDWDDIMKQLSIQKAENYVDYKNIIEDFRKKHRMSLKIFSIESGIAESTLHHIVYRNVSPTPTTAAAIREFIFKYERRRES